MQLRLFCPPSFCVSQTVKADEIERSPTMKTHLCVFLSLASALGVTAATRVWDGGSGHEFLILNNASLAPSSGSFAGLSEGAQLPVGGQLFRITYRGGDGNEVVLTRLHAPPPERTGVVPLPNGSRKVTGLGLPGLSYLIQAADSLHSPITWTDLGSADADSTGMFTHIDPDAQNHPQGFFGPSRPDSGMTSNQKPRAAPLHRDFELIHW